MRAATLVVTALLGFIPQVFSTGSFELRIRSFTNHLGRLSSGLCCDGGMPNSDGYCLTQCRTRFRVCLKIYQANIDTTSPCTFGDITTPVVGGNNLDSSSLQAKGISNPIVFPFDFTWPGTFSLIVEAWHDTNETSRTDDSLITRMTKQSIADVNGPWTEEENRGTDMDLRVAYRVTCAQHYYGPGCEALCRPRDDTFGHYTCSPMGKIICIPGWTGDYCLKPLCLPGCDAEHGSCKVPGECVCQSGYVGELCDECEAHPGCVHGTCHKPWECNCNDGWGGLFCNQDLNYCTNHRPCRNGGTCHNTGQGSYTCHCPPDFTGDDCEISRHSCATESCLNGGVCRPDEDDQLTCACPEGFSGARCETRTITCADAPCLNGATCSMMGTGYRCSCAPGYEGADCEREVDPCSINPCENGASCTRVGDGFHCACINGYEGARCEINIDDCVGVMCERGGTCVDLIGGYKCRCVPGFVGSRCETRVDLCVAKPCANGGECTMLDNDYKCTCRPGFTGKGCGIEIDECASQPCQNGGICRDRVDGFTCRCPSEFSGKTCGSPIRAAGDSQPHVGDKGRIDESLSGQHVALIAALSATVPALALVAAVALACIKRRRRRNRSAADAEARAQNERNSISAGGRIIRNTWGKNDPAECQNAHNASVASDDCKEAVRREHKLLNTESAARLLAARLSAPLPVNISQHRLSQEEYCTSSDTSLVKRALEGGGVFVLDDHCLPPTFATQV